MLKIMSEEYINRLKKEKPFLRRMSTETKIDCIKRNLKKNGYVSRNHSLNHYETKLSAKISDLKKQGWKIETIVLNGSRVGKNYRGNKGGDTVYVLIREGRS